MPNHLEEDVLERLPDVEDVGGSGESPQTLVEDVVEEGVLGVPENVLAAIPDLEIFPLELFNVFLLVPVPATAQVHKLLEGCFPVMDGKQQGV